VPPLAAGVQQFVERGYDVPRADVADGWQVRLVRQRAPLDVPTSDCLAAADALA
jgi:hypothetical protein